MFDTASEGSHQFIFFQLFCFVLFETRPGYTRRADGQAARVANVVNMKAAL